MSHRRFWLLLTLVVLLLATLAFASPALAGDAPNPVPHVRFLAPHRT
ncbi:MAG: hypothetical protein HZY76_01035 [Anaerolineae bacterium]|nr:MAG: hypothetical protein HZY76_01035 [Anaerolineae bacterium]